MFHRTTFTFSTLLLLVLSGRASGASGSSMLKRLRVLAGNWAVVDSAGELTDLRGSYRTVAGGAAVIETLFAGTAEETVTVYHLEDNRVSVTQLSGRGAPSRLVSRGVASGTTLRFEADAEKTEPGKLKELVLTLIDDQHVKVEWSFESSEGDPESRAFELHREAPVEELAAEVARLRVDLESLQRELDRRLQYEIKVRQKGKRSKTLIETRTLAPGPGWSVSGVPLRRRLHEQTQPFASTFAAERDKGLTVAHYGFRAGPGCRLRFSVLGGHGYIAVVEETRSPPRKIQSIPEFASRLESGDYGQIIERIVGGRWEKHPRAVEWDLARFEGKSLRLYVVDAVTNHYGQVAISEVSILQKATE